MSTHFGLLFFVVIKFTVARGGQCGITYVQPNITSQIVGGTEAKENSYPWMVSVQSSSAGGQPYHSCGGTVIRASETVDQSDIIVTAAHCLYTKPTHVLLGTNSLSKSTPGRQLLRITKTVYHPSFNPQTIANDVAALKLEKPIKFDKYIQPACLPDVGEKRKEGERGTVTGWGLLKEGGKTHPDMLQQAVIPVYNMQKCKTAYGFSVPVDEKIQFCAGYQEGKIDACSDDSGGPWILKNRNNQYALQGIVSFGKGCAQPNSPGVYVLVSSYTQWIKDQVKALTSVKG